MFINSSRYSKVLKIIPHEDNFRMYLFYFYYIFSLPLDFGMNKILILVCTSPGIPIFSIFLSVFSVLSVVVV